MDDIKKVLTTQSRPLKIRELGRLMGVDSESYPSFRRIVKDALAEGKIHRMRGGRLTAEAKPQSSIKGKLLVSRSGHGFVIPEEGGGDVFISSRDMGGAIHGEEVRLVIKNTQAGKSREGRILEVLNREKGRVVGRLKKGKFGYYVTPDDRRFPDSIEVENPHNFALGPDLIVTVRLSPWEAPYLPPHGFVEEVLGKAGSPGMDINSLVVSRGLPREFDPSVKPELARIRRKIPAKETLRRLDLRDQIIFTIDPFDAKDHDDAIGVEVIRDGYYRLGVHIADVSHFVRENTALDREARMRGNSIYLVDRVIPMLPEKLSGDICSLVEDEDRLTLSFIAEIDAKGKVYNWFFKESIMRSAASLTYEEVQDHFNGQGKSRIDRTQGESLDLLLMISRALRQKRLEKGSLDFDLPEPSVVIDDEGKVLDVFTVARLPSHQVVEELMLLANRYAATFLQENGVPILYRVHAKPDNEKIENFSALLNEMGFAVNFRGEITPRKLQRVVELVKDKPEQPFVQEILLRSLAKAVYQPENIGHFGLAFDRYTHFTSPIRRYPDLTVHRALKMLLNRQLTRDIVGELRGSLKALGAHCTSTEIAADEAERDSIKIKQLEYLSERLGGVYEGLISGVVKAGMFVELIGSMAEGFVPFSSLKDDYYTLDEGKHRAYGRRTGKVYRLGDRVKVIIAKVDIEHARADFALVSEPAEKEEKRKKKKRK